MRATSSAVIDLVEAGYDLDLGTNDWLPHLVAVGKPLWANALSCYASCAGGMSEDQQPLITHVHFEGGPADLPARVYGAARAVGPDSVAAWSREVAARGVAVLSELRVHWPDVCDALTDHLECQDALLVYGADPDLSGVSFSIPTPEVIELTAKQRQQWQMLAVHLGAGYRLRRSLTESADPEGMTPTEVPLGAEALLDPNKFVLSHAVGNARKGTASELIRDAAVRVDRARGRLRKSDPDEALEIWHGLVRGRWSLVDWFDTDGRRFVLAKPNAPDLGDPRGLSQSEAQVATYAARGESGKIIGYRFGISPQRVSVLLKSAMRKFRVKTRAQLVERLRGMPAARESDLEE